MWQSSNSLACLKVVSICQESIVCFITFESASVAFLLRIFKRPCKVQMSECFVWFWDCVHLKATEVRQSIQSLYYFLLLIETTLLSQWMLLLRLTCWRNLQLENKKPVCNSFLKSCDWIEMHKAIFMFFRRVLSLCRVNITSRRHNQFQLQNTWSLSRKD